jgi:hypothetical protein
MHNVTSTIKRLLLVPAIAVLAFLGGCGGGVHVEGPGFELGGKKEGDKKVPDRAPLLIPPDRARLPAPQQPVASAPPSNWPKDPGEVKKAEASAAVKKQKEYEDKGDWSKKADLDEFDKLMDPMERNENGLLDKWFKGQNDNNSVDEGER